MKISEDAEKLINILSAITAARLMPLVDVSVIIFSESRKRILI